MNWINAHKLATIFGIVGGVYLIFQLYQSFFSLESKFDSEIWIREIHEPNRLQNYTFHKEIVELIPEGFDRYELAEDISDTISAQLGEIPFGLEFRIRNTIPENFSRYYAAKRIDSLISEIIYPVQASYFVEASIKNTGSKTATNMRFELPAEGYFELFENDNMVGNGRFDNSIPIPELRVSNKAIVRIWSYNHISNYEVKESQEVRFTFDEGIIHPKTKEVVISEGILYWIFSHPWTVLYIISIILIWFPYINWDIVKKRKTTTKT